MRHGVPGAASTSTTRYDYTYDGASNRVTQTETPTHTIVYTYDTTYNRIATIEDTDTGLGTTSRYQYDYNASGLIIQVTDPDAGGATRFQYDYTGDRLTRVTDALGNVTRYDYDATPRLTDIVTDPGGPSPYRTQYDYSANLVTKTTYDADGTPVITTYSYDALSLRIASVDNGGLTQFVFAIDAVPEPATLLLFGAGLFGLGLLRRRLR